MCDAAKPSIDEDQILRAKVVAFRARIAQLEEQLDNALSLMRSQGDQLIQYARMIENAAKPDKS